MIARAAYISNASWRAMQERILIGKTGWTVIANFLLRIFSQSRDGKMAAFVPSVKKRDQAQERNAK